MDIVMDMDLVLQTVMLYHEGHHYHDMDKLSQAFHPKAHISGYYEGELACEPRDRYMELLSGGKSSAQVGIASTIRVVSVDMTETTAVVKVANSYHGACYTSYLSMIKIDGSWSIINGLFHSEIDRDRCIVYK